MATPSDRIEPPFTSPIEWEWCGCGHATADHDPEVGCLIFECACTPPETIARLARDR